tara:strand:- start:1920 stop:2219 length:300 start_codon:yes stop_codon:yes gene_type:complete
MDDFNNIVFYLKNKIRTPKLKNECKQKYEKLYNMSEKLFDKIYEKDCSETDITIIKKMITMKIQKDNGFIDKLNADKAIGETLCDIYVKPMLNEKNRDK